MHTYIYTYIQSLFMHTYVRTYVIHTYVRTYVRTYIYSFIHAYVHTYTHTYLYTYIYVHTYIHTHIRTYMYIHTYRRHQSSEFDVSPSIQKYVGSCETKTIILLFAPPTEGRLTGRCQRDKWQTTELQVKRPLEMCSWKWRYCSI